MTTRTCPTCATTLVQSKHEVVSIDRCPDGHGVWLDRGELRLVVASEAVPRPDAERNEAHLRASRDHVHEVVAEIDSPRRPCPVCGVRMRLTEYAGSGIPIDECSEHGAWLDAGELERIEAYAEAVRDQARPGAARPPQQAVTGIDVPAGLLASLRSLGSQP